MSTTAMDPVRILAVDDEPAMRDAYRCVFLHRLESDSEADGSLGALEARLFPGEPPSADDGSFELVCCSQGEEAVEAIRHAMDGGRPFSLALIDVRMPPGPDGIWVAEQARRLDPHLEIVIATAYSDVSPDEIARRVPPVEQLFYIQKPLQPEALRRLATSLAAKWQAGQAARQAQAELEEANEALVREIEERREAEGALRRSEGLLSSILAAAPSGVGILRDRVIQWVNERLEEMTGYERAELVGHGARLLYGSDEQFDHVGAAYAQLEGARTASIETQWRRKDGTTIDVLLGASYLDPADPSAGVAFTATDMSERKRAEQALHESEERFRALVENASDVFITVAESGTITFTSPSATKVLGYDPEEANGRNAFDFVHPDDRELARDAFRQVLADGHTRALVEFRVRAKDGSWRHVQAVASVPGPDSPIEGVLINYRDVTERKQLEEHLHQTSKLESIGTLAGGVAHDFNNILTGIIGYADMLQTEGAVLGEHTRDLDKIRHLADRAAGLTRQLLLFSRQQPIEPVVLNPNELVENLSKMLRRIIGEDIALELALAPDVGNVRADPGQIEQVLMNLAVNARDAMPGGGQLTIETANTSVDEEYADQHLGLVPGDYITIAVSDTGCGMDAETRQRVFEPFFTTKEVGKGTGLGLATVYGIVQQHEGGVWVYSEPKQGTTLQVYLPRVDQRAQNASAREEDSAPQGSETILLVEDEDTVREIAQQVLAKRGYRVLAAPTPAEAKQLFEHHDGEIALLLTDVVMPGKTGPGLHEWLAAKRPTLKVLFMSGYTEHAAVSHDLLGGQLPFLQKPFTPAALAQKVRDVLDA